MDYFGFLGANDIISFPTGEGSNDAGHDKTIIHINTGCPWKNKFLDSLSENLNYLDQQILIQDFEIRKTQ